MEKLQVVLGGTSGMGLATAKALGVFGPVLVGGRNQQRLDNAVAELEAAGIDAYGKTVDIADANSLDDFAKYAASIAPIGALVNAAGVDSGGPDLILAVNFKGTVNVINAFMPYLQDAKVINYSSITGYFHQPTPTEIEIWQNPDAPDFVERMKAELSSRPLDPRMAFLGDDYIYYPASKAFTIYYTKANTVRLGKKNTAIFSVAPGSFDTPMLRESPEEQLAKIAQGTAFGRLGDPAEMADFIVKLLEPGHEYLTGVDLILDGGKSAMTLVKQLD